MTRLFILVIVFLSISCENERYKTTIAKQYLIDELTQINEKIEKYDKNKRLILKQEQISSAPNFQKKLYKEINYEYNERDLLTKEKHSFQDGYNFEKVYNYDNQFKLIETKIVSNDACKNIIKYFYNEQGKKRLEIEFELKDTLVFLNGTMQLRTDTIQTSKISIEYPDSTRMISKESNNIDTLYDVIESKFRNGKLIEENHKFYKSKYPQTFNYYRNEKGNIDSIIIKEVNEDGLISLYQFNKGEIPRTFFLTKHYYSYDKLDSLVFITISDEKNRMKTDIEIKR